MPVDPANLNALVDDLNTGAARASTGDGQLAKLASWLAAAVEQGANDLLLVAGSPPTLRIEGRLVQLGSTLLDNDEAADALLPALAAHARRQEIAITRRSGSFSLEESLVTLVRQGVLDRNEALARAHHPEDLQLLLGA